ncbi:hypothetical protein BH23ACT11_BH23ACT11_00230 [soil metagenome]
MVDIAPSPAKFVMYWNCTRKGSEYRWRLRSSGGETLAWSITGYADKADCEREIASARKSYPEAVIRDLTVLV